MTSWVASKAAFGTRDALPVEVDVSTRGGSMFVGEATMLTRGL